MFSMCSELTPRAPIPDGRMEQIMQPCQEKHLDEKINDVVHPVESRDFYRLEPIFCVLVGLKVPVKNETNTFLNTFFSSPQNQIPDGQSYLLQFLSGHKDRQGR